MHDIIVIGGGPAGSTAATFLAQKGHKVLLLERDRFPRFQIGESLLPYNNDLFDRLGVSEKLAQGQFNPKYGAHFITGDGAVAYTFRFDRNLPKGYQRSFQVRRAEFDDLLLRNAASNGVDVREGVQVAAVELADPSRASVRTASGETFDARFVVDASGCNSVIGHKLGDKHNVKSLQKIAIFAHYNGVKRAAGRDAGNTSIAILKDSWFWMIPVTTEVMSVGLVVDRDHVIHCGLTPEQLLEKTIEASPHMSHVMAQATRTSQVYVRKDFSFRMKNLVGPNFALAGDAAGFLDPIFSTGVFMAMKSADLVATAADQRLRTGSTRLLRQYERDMTGALTKYFRFISNFYRHEFLEVFLQPNPSSRLIRAIVGVLAGNIFNKHRDRLQLGAFFLLVQLHKWRRSIAPRIDWDSLPAAADASSATAEEQQYASAI
jgi:flavin-dependent dehydrogenase